MAVSDREDTSMGDEKKVHLKRSGKGPFVRAYGEDAIVLGAITGYEVKKLSKGNHMCGYPASVNKEVFEKLENASVSYEYIGIIDDKSEDMEKRIRDFGADNRYEGLVALWRKNNPSDTSENVTKKKRRKNKGPEDEFGFIDALCMGLDPYTGKPAETLDLTNPDNIRWLFRVKGKMKR